MKMLDEAQTQTEWFRMSDAEVQCADEVESAEIETQTEVAYPE